MKEIVVAEKEMDRQQPSWMAAVERKLKMTVEEQVAEMNANWPAIDAAVKAADKLLSGCEKLVTDEDEIAEIVSKNRRATYEASLRD